jgi:16S rRNA (cytosine967-C5)-methyltransferase
MPRPKIDPSREHALKILHRTESNLSFPKLLIEYAPHAPSLEGRQKAFAYELVMGTLRYRGTLDWVLQKLTDRPVEEFTVWIRNILRMGLYQILYLDRVPKSAAVDESVKLAKTYGHAGTAGLVNAVLRNAQRDALLNAVGSLGESSVSDLAVKYSHPEWLVELLVNDWGVEAAVRILNENNRIPPLTARVNTLRTTLEALLKGLETEGIQATTLPFLPDAIELTSTAAPSELKAHKNGLLYFQDASSMLAAHCLGVQPGQNVLDVCAGPGGKTTHIATLMENKGAVWALDVHDHRIKLIEENARRLDARIIKAVRQDATDDLSKDYRNMDAVIVDAPCSGIGVIRRRLDMKWRLQPTQIDRLVQLQTAIMERAAECVRPDGALLYCTCTITRRENSEVVQGFLTRHPDFTVQPQVPKSLEKYVTTEGFVQILPGDENMDGFFIARLKRLYYNGGRT